MKPLSQNRLLLPLLLLQLFACSSPDRPVVTYTVSQGEYREVLEVSGTIQAVRNHSIVAPRLSGLTVIKLTPEGQVVEKGDTVCVLSSTDMEKRLEMLQKEVESLETDLINLEISNASLLTGLELELQNNQIEIAITGLDSIQRQFVPEVQKKLLDLKYQQAMIQRSKLEKRYVAKKAIAESDTRALKSRLVVAKNNLQQVDRERGELFITAPFRGMVMHVVAPTVYVMSSEGGSGSYGGAIKEGSQLMPFLNSQVLQMPDLSEMQIVALVPEVDFKRVELNQRVNIRVESGQGVTTTGKVVKKSLEGAVMQYSSGSSVKRYELILSVDSCHLQMKPGLSARCEIVLNEAEECLVLPSVAIHSRDSLKFVYLQENGKFKEVPVETGFSNSARTVVSKGLEPDQTVALTEPHHSRIVKAKAKPLSDK